MPGIGDRRNKLYMLDKELCCALYIRLGSHEKVSQRLFTEGVKHPVTGEAFSRAGVATAIKKSEMYHEYFIRRAKDPSIPQDPTIQEQDDALKVIKDRMPAQKAVLDEAIRLQAYRIAHESVYMDNISMNGNPIEAK